MTISEIAEKSSISITTLRYYEKIGLIPTVPRNSRGIRDYDDSFLVWLELIQQLKVIGMQLDAIQKYVGLIQYGAASIEVRKELVRAAHDRLRQRIVEMQQAIVQADIFLEQGMNKWEAIFEKTIKTSDASGRLAG